MTAAGVAAQYASGGGVSGFDRAIYCDGLYTILARGGRIATAKSRLGRNNQLIGSDEPWYLSISMLFLRW